MTTPVILNWTQIEPLLKNIDPIEEVENGFMAFAKNMAIIPPVSELLFNQPPGEVHIKYGYLIDDQFFVIKVASGFSDNPAKYDCSANSGLMMLFSKNTGFPECILLDEGNLTSIRTAAAGAVAAKHLMPSKVRRIGIIGTGEQARLQLKCLSQVTECRDVIVYGRNEKKLDIYQQDMQAEGFNISPTGDIAEVGSSANLIVTTTAAKEPLLHAEHIQPGTHITAIGSDTPEKQELSVELLTKADKVVADSIAQSIERGEISQAIRAKQFDTKQVVELGDLILDEKLRRQNDQQITIADLTGVAIQDIQISKAVYMAHLEAMN